MSSAGSLGDFSRADLAAWESALAKLEAAEEAVFESPGDLALRLDPKTVQTPALDVIDGLIQWAWGTPDARLIISMPPQEGKSQRVTKTGTLWALLQNPERRLAIASYSSELAEGFGRDIRNWITTFDGTEGTLDLGLRIASDNGAAKRWRLRDHLGGVISVGLQGSLTGKPVDGLVIDDPFKDAAEADSEPTRERVWQWWQATAGTRLAPGAPVIIIMTRWHEDDLAGRLLAAEDGHVWRVVNIPALADHNPAKGQSDVLGRRPGEWMISARSRTAEQFEATRARVGSRTFNALYQGRPSPEAGGILERLWWGRYSQEKWTVENGVYWALGLDGLLTSWDMTFKDTKASDFVAGQVWGWRGADVFLLDQVHARLSFTKTLREFERLAAKWPQASLHLVEDKANGSAVIDSLRRKIPGIVPVNPGANGKVARANAIAPFVESGNVFLPSQRVALFKVDELVEEAASFPNGAHDDQVDALTQAVSRMLLRAGAGHAYLEAMKRQLGDVDRPMLGWRERVAKLKEGGAHAWSGRPRR